MKIRVWKLKKNNLKSLPWPLTTGISYLKESIDKEWNLATLERTKIFPEEDAIELIQERFSCAYFENFNFHPRQFWSNQWKSFVIHHFDLLELFHNAIFETINDIVSSKMHSTVISGKPMMILSFVQRWRHKTSVNFS